MDSWRDHLKFGLVFEIPFISIMYFWKQWFQTTYSITDIGLYIFLFQLLVLIVISPLMPDIDHKLGKLREGITFIGLIIGLIGLTGYLFGLDLTVIMAMGLAISSPAYLVCYTTDHRKFVHSITFCVIYGLGIYFLLNRLDLAVLGLVGCYSHLMADKIFIKFW